MNIIYHRDEVAQASFAKAAAKHFYENPKSYTYALADPAPGELLAIRWNNCTVLIVRLSESHTPALYPTSQWFDGVLPPIQAEPKSVISP